MLGVLRILFSGRWANPWLVTGCLLLGSLAEAAGIASLLPLLTILTDPGGSDTSPVSLAIFGALEALGVTPDLTSLMIVVIGGLIAKALLTLLAMRYVGYAVSEVATGLRSELIKTLLQVRWGYFVEQPLGRIANAMSGEAMRGAIAYKMAAEFFANVLQTSTYVLLALVMSWRLTLIALVTGAVIMAVLHFLVRMARRAGLKQTQRTAQLVTYLTDVLNNVKPLKAMARQDAFAQSLDRKIAGLRKALRRQILSSEALKGLQEVLIAVALGFGLYVGLRTWNLPIAELLVMSVVILQVIKNIAKSQRQYQKAALAESPFFAVQDLIAETRAARENAGGGVAPSFERGCRFESVAFGYRGTPVLRDVNLEIPARGVTVLTGASGAGKSTIIDLLLGFYGPQAGRILVDGTPLEELDVMRWRRMIGYVPQDLVLFHDSILANVTLDDPEVSEDDARRALELAGAWDFVARLPNGMMSEVGEKGAQLSGGQRQRIALARALAHRPRLLILDEVTSALDDETERAICATLRELTDEVTILVVTHRPGFLAIADRIYLIAEGRTTPIEPGAKVALQRQA